MMMTTPIFRHGTHAHPILYYLAGTTLRRNGTGDGERCYTTAGALTDGNQHGNGGVFMSYAGAGSRYLRAVAGVHAHETMIWWETQERIGRWR